MSVSLEVVLPKNPSDPLNYVVLDNQRFWLRGLLSQTFGSISDPDPLFGIATIAETLGSLPWQNTVFTALRSHPVIDLVTYPYPGLLLMMIWREGFLSPESTVAALIVRVYTDALRHDFRLWSVPRSARDSSADPFFVSLERTVPSVHHAITKSSNELSNVSPVLFRLCVRELVELHLFGSLGTVESQDVMKLIDQYSLE